MHEKTGEPAPQQYSDMWNIHLLDRQRLGRMLCWRWYMLCGRLVECAIKGFHNCSPALHATRMPLPGWMGTVLWSMKQIPDYLRWPAEAPPSAVVDHIAFPCARSNPFSGELDLWSIWLRENLLCQSIHHILPDEVRRKVVFLRSAFELLSCGNKLSRTNLTGDEGNPNRESFEGERMNRRC